MCQTIAAHGYTGVELAPFTFAQSVADISTKKRSLIAKEAEQNGTVDEAIVVVFDTTPGTEVILAESYRYMMGLLQR